MREYVSSNVVERLKVFESKGGGTVRDTEGVKTAHM